MWRPDNVLGHKLYSKLFLMQFMTLWTEMPHYLEEKHPTRGYNCEGEVLPSDNDKFLKKEGDVKWRKSGGDMVKKSPDSAAPGGEASWRNSNTKSNRSAFSRTNRKNKRPRSKSSRGKCVLIPTENRWERPKETSDEIEKVTRYVQNIFNKITTDNYKKMLGQLKEIEIKKLSVMEAIIQVIFEKAQLESNFCSLYAKLCNDIGNNLSVEYDVEEGENSPPRSRKVSFKRALLVRCQIGFEEKKLPQKLPSTLTSREEISEFMMVQNKVNSKNMGMIKFIGELFLNGMLGENIIHRCLSSLLGEWNSNEPMDEVSVLNLEHFIHLMSTAGSKIDHSKGAKVMRGYFGALDHLISRPGIPSKLKFRLMDLKDLRKNRWVSPKRK
jgi:translation initiation factor 4G